jgi:hypothetical protein
VALLPVLDLLSQSDACAEFPLAEFKKRMVSAAVARPWRELTARAQATLSTVVGNERDALHRMQQLQVGAA